MRTSLLLLIAVLLAGCSTPCCRRGSSADLTSAPETVTIDGRTFRLQAELWRDFQPVAPPDGQPMMAIARVAADDNMPLPDDIAIDRLWVLNGRKQWSAATAEQPERLTAYASGGPKWGPGINVDVVTRLARGSDTWLVRAAGVRIKRTD